VTDEFVDVEFGTGAVKITPAHDHNDYEVGKRHKLPFITIISDEGLIQGDCGQFTGMKRFDARKAVLAALKDLGLYRDTKDNPMVVPICNRSKDIVEPLIKPQWYVKCDKMAEDAMKAVESGELKIIPEHHVKTWNYWMSNIRDWCISRQLWWGHRIPAYFVTVNVPTFKKELFEESAFWVSGRNEEEARKKAALRFAVQESQIHLKQDDDVLDTWFSSGLFPFSIFGWPENTPDLQAFYPGSLLETGHDIIFFWVARMVFFGQRLLGKLPFKEVFLHPIVRDAHGRKMSKSLGNVIDPMDVIVGINLEALHEQLLTSNLDPKEIERAKAGQKSDYPNGIPECGTDALRFALLSYMNLGRDINLDILRVQGYRFFCNKLWNAVKFALMYFNDDFKNNPPKITEGDKLAVLGTESPMDLWMLSKLSAAVEGCHKGFTNYDFPTVTTSCYNLWLYDLCDVYLESLKPVFASGNQTAIMGALNTLYYTLDTGLKLLSPLMPFITEELYQRLPHGPRKRVASICLASYPTPENFCWRNLKLEQDVEFVQKVIHSIRSARSDYNIPNKTKTEAFFKTSDQGISEILKNFNQTIVTLAYCSSVEPTDSIPEGCAIITVSDKCVVYLILKGLIDATKELAKLEKKKDGLQQTIKKLEQAMGAKDYQSKVPEEVRTSNSEKLQQTQGELDRLADAVQVLLKMT